MRLLFKGGSCVGMQLRKCAASIQGRLLYNTIRCLRHKEPGLNIAEMKWPQELSIFTVWKLEFTCTEFMLTVLLKWTATDFCISCLLL